MSSLINYASGGLLWLGLLVKIPDLVRHRRDPFLRAICSVLGFAGLSFFLGAPPTVGAINDVSGIRNLAAPLTYASITAVSASSLVLIVYWRGGHHVQRTARRWITGYAILLGGIAATFAIGDTPLERRTDFDTFYATTPFIREMIVLYLVGHLTAAGVTTVLSLRWAREVHGWLRAGMVTLGIGMAFNCGYSISKLTAVVARWCGRDWSMLGTTVSPAAAGFGALLSTAGIVIPLAGHRLSVMARSWRTYVRLGPLERELDGVLVRQVLRNPRPRWPSPDTRLMWRQTSIHNALHHLDAFLDFDLFESARAAAFQVTGDGQRAEAAAWAAVISAAARDEHSPLTGSSSPGAVRRLSSQPLDRAALVRIADELATSCSVAEGRERTAMPANGTK
ncbi:MAB_1171c family putative transporter [Streptomyces sp. NPDC046197]|uniref:MAB_1171c family putative transporter n=1 Tax=Streptomyces sp. NPDC046197 TaxID=3154337 RepID=UPI0033ED5EB1